MAANLEMIVLILVLMEYPLTLFSTVMRTHLHVLILVLMEYPLTRGEQPGVRLQQVLILVLMEYPLTTKLYALYAYCCLNPCSNGIPSDRSFEKKINKCFVVLILVLMEYPLTQS